MFGWFRKLMKQKRAGDAAFAVKQANEQAVLDILQGAGLTVERASYGAYNFGYSCEYCNSDCRYVYAPYEVISPIGELFIRNKVIGQLCVRCRSVCVGTAQGKALMTKGISVIQFAQTYAVKPITRELYIEAYELLASQMKDVQDKLRALPGPQTPFRSLPQ